MGTGASLLVVGAGVAVLLVLVLQFRLPAFLALLITSAGVGLALGLDSTAVLDSIREGMGGTLGFVAVVVGLGAMFGALLEAAGGVRAVSNAMLDRLGFTHSAWALAAAGFLVGIPVFFDVAFIIMVPLVLRLAAHSGRPALYFATPLLAGLAVSHTFIPPTPGPIAVAELLGADLGWVIAMGASCGIPATILAGPLLAGRFEFRSARTSLIAHEDDARVPVTHVSAAPAIFAILLPLALIVCNTIGQQMLEEGAIRAALSFVGHPFVALIAACLYAYLFFGLKSGMSRERLQDLMTRALEPAGIVVLVTGAGGVFKQVLIDSGVGDMLGAMFAGQAMPPMLLAFALAASIRIAQGSATVAMITAAGLTAPLLQHLSLDPVHTALVVVAISSGAILASHVNDSGFWLVSRYLELSEAQTLRSWTVISTVAGLTGFATASLLAFWL